MKKKVFQFKSSTLLLRIFFGMLWNCAAVYGMLEIKEHFIIHDSPPTRAIASVISEHVQNGRPINYLLLVLPLYGILSGLHFIFQYVFAAIFYFLSNRRKLRPSAKLPKVTAVIIVPSFNEDPEILKRCLISCLKSRFSGKLIISLVDDCSTKNREGLAVIYQWAQREGIEVILKTKNEGKRRAQHWVFAKYKNTVDYYITIDSDTLLDPNAISILISELIEDKSLGANTGEVLALNNDSNILTNLINSRYWLAFNIERGAQSLFKTVSCCSGPLSVYRADLINKVKDKYISQHFLGVECTYGDDRHLTNLILGTGHKVTYNPHAKALTEVPEKVPQYMKQQLRWSKSFYREVLYTPFIKRKSIYLCFDLFCQAVLPILLLVCLTGSLFEAATYSPNYMMNYFWWFILIAIVRTGPGICWAQNKDFIYFPLYGVLHIFLLMPLRFYALATLKDSRWGTR